MSKMCQSNRLNTMYIYIYIYIQTHTYILFSIRKWVPLFLKELLRRTFWEGVNIETLKIVG